MEKREEIVKDVEYADVALKSALIIALTVEITDDAVKRSIERIDPLVDIKCEYLNLTSSNFLVNNLILFYCL